MLFLGMLSLFYNHHLTIFQFLENLKNYHIKIRSSNQEKKIYRRVLHLRKQFVDEKVALLRQFVKLISYKFMPNVTQ
jgi:hypothetical protein